MAPAIAGRHSLACPAPMGPGFVPMVPAINTCAAFSYGICETMNGNWASILMAGPLANTPAAASLSLTLFWAAQPPADAANFPHRRD